MSESTLKIFTLNCWGIPYISKDRKERMQAIGEHIASNEYDVVCLQEVWAESDFLSIKNMCKDVLPFSHYFYSGVMGSGLCVLSRWRIEEVFFHPWRLNGYVHKIQHGDWFGGKGIAYCRIKYYGLVINLHLAHLHAKYHEDDIYLAHRAVQGFTTAEFIKLTSRSADISILAGDLNTEPGELVYRLICETAKMTDPFEATSNGVEMGTCQTVENSYSDAKLFSTIPNGQRLDHVFYYSDYEVVVEKYYKPLPVRVSGKAFSYSDHEAVVCELKVTRQKAPLRETNANELIKSLKELEEVCKTALSEINYSRKSYYFYSVFISALFLSLLPFQVTTWSHSIDICQIWLSVAFAYTVFMATLWNRIEKNSIKAARASIDKIKSALEVEKNTEK